MKQIHTQPFHSKIQVLFSFLRLRREILQTYLSLKRMGHYYKNANQEQDGESHAPEEWVRGLQSELGITS